jgi:hypothetical protein
VAGLVRPGPGNGGGRGAAGAVDRAVDALEPWDKFTGRLPVPRQEPRCSGDSDGDGVGLWRVLGHKSSSLRRRPSTRRGSKAASLSLGWGISTAGWTSLGHRAATLASD